MLFLKRSLLNELKYRLYLMRTTSSVSESGVTESENHSVVMRKIRSHSIKLTVSSFKKEKLMAV